MKTSKVSVATFKTIIDNVLRHKKPKTKNLYLLHSHKRLSDDPRYIRFIDDIIASKKNKDKRGYRNRATLERRDWLCCMLFVLY